MKRRIKPLFSLFLLLYFVGFAVAPVSAILPSERCADIGADQDAIKKPTDKTNFFLVDLALWEALKKVKRSDDSKNIIITDKGDDNCQENLSFRTMPCIPGIVGPATAPFSGVSSFFDSSISAVYKYVYFDHSGLSPPFLA
jgi:hypothetical protein